MPSYKTHSIHGEVVNSMMDMKPYIDQDLLKLFCMGPDAMILTDYKTFDYQHAHKTKDYFLSLIQTIDELGLQYDPEVMSFLYGQLDHFVVDTVFHPYIYYVTEKLPTHKKLSGHCLMELQLDNYVSEEFGCTNPAYYSSKSVQSTPLKSVVNRVYQKVFGLKNEFPKYERGIHFMRLFDSVVRTDSSKFFSKLADRFKIGDVTYSPELEQISPFLNLEKKEWRDPETNQPHHESFHDLWNKSVLLSCQLLSDVNEYLFHKKEIRNPLLVNDISYNTGLACSKGQKLTYVKKYPKR